MRPRQRPVDGLYFSPQKFCNPSGLEPLMIAECDNFPAVLGQLAKAAFQSVDPI
jgi:hypothetical protein